MKSKKKVYVRWRSAKLTHLGSVKLTHLEMAETAGVEGTGLFPGSLPKE